VTRPNDQTVNTQITVKNVGGSPATTGPITVTYPIPAGVTLNPPVNDPNWQVSINNGTLTATYTGSLPINSGQSTPPLNLTGTVTTQKPISNTVIVSTPNQKSTSTNFPIIPRNPGKPNLMPAVTVDNAPDGSIVLTADVRNIGDAPAATGPITLTTKIPNGLTLTAPTSDPNWQVSISNGTLTATYMGPLPINPGQATPPLRLTGTLSKGTPVVVTTTLTSPEIPGPVSITYPVPPTNTNPDLMTIASADRYRLEKGQSTIIHVFVANRPTAGIAMTGPLTVTFTVPRGEEVISEDGNGSWTFGTGNNPLAGMFEAFAASEPAQTGATALKPGTTIVATYLGAFPFLPGQSTPEFRLRVVATGSAGKLVNVFTADVLNNLPDNHSATVVLSVVKSSHNHHEGNGHDHSHDYGNDHGHDRDHRHHVKEHCGC
jgi:uncharacterized protein YcnI